MPLKFADLALSPELQAGIDASGYVDCTPIQEVTIPPILDGKDVSGLAQTGTGKTAAFLLPLMDRIIRSRQAPDDNDPLKDRRFADWQKTNYILILVPTRELAEQVYENVLKLRGAAELNAVSVYGGVSYDKQKAAFRDGVQFVVATPGRLIDLYKEHVVDLRQVRAVVFDEADRMFDMGFKDDMKFILQRIPKDRQFMVFSATLNFDVLNTAYQFGAQPVECDVSRDQAKAENVEDKIFHCGNDEKARHLLSILRKTAPTQAIIFSNFKNNVARISHFLNINDVPSVGISSLLTQAQRNRVMEQFKGSSNRNILVATDVAARGLDIKGVDLVINYELPDDAENYVHRIGRTGRAGAKGLAFSFVGDRDVDALTRIEAYLGHKVVVDWLDDADLINDFKPLPSEREYERQSKPGGPPPRDSRSGGGPGRGGRGGDRPRGPDRGGRRGPPQSRDSRPPREPRAAGPVAEGTGTAPAAAQGEGRQHRDKVMGRHSPGSRPEGRRDERGGQQSRGRDQRGDRHQGGPNGGGEHRQPRGPRSPDQRQSQPRRPEHRSGQPRHGQPSREGVRRPLSRRPSAAGNASLGQKVSGFFKKLFGSKDAPR
jgi:ATP-dependent RNA helicase RhlB